MGKSDDITWITAHGRHIPIGAGQSVEDAIKQAFQNDSKQSQIAKNEQEAKRLNDESKARDTQLNGAKVGVTNGSITFNGKPIDKLSTADAGEKGSDSLADHLKNGELSQDRLEVHRQIIEDYFKGHKPYGPGEEKVAMFTGGGGASGKGTFSGNDRDTKESNVGKFYSQDKNPLKVDPDEIKKSLAVADGHVDKEGKANLDNKLTGYYHEESSALAKQIYSTALQNNYPVLYDGTATGVKSTVSKIEQAEKHGYKTEMCFVCSDWKTVRQNSLDRYEKSGRLVPIDHLTKAHRQSYDAITQLQNKFHSFKLYDNAGRNLRLVGQQTGKKPLKIMNKDSWERISKSGQEFLLSKYQVQKYNEDAAKITVKRAKEGKK